MKLDNLGSNQTQVTTSTGEVVLFSYGTPVAARINGEYFRTSKKWSVTTNQHISRWLDGIKAEVRDQQFFDQLGAF